jgi:hypothetical protein
MSTPNPTTKKKFIAPVLECTGELMPNVPNMTDFFKQLGSIPAVLTLQLSELPTCIALALWDDIKSIVITPLDATEDFLGALSVTLPSQTKNTVRDRPEEWRRRADDLQENYKLYFMLGLINLLGTFAIHILQIPLPLISGCVVGDLLSAEGRKKIGETILKSLPALILILPEPYRSLCLGFYGVLNNEEVLRNFLSYWISEVKKIIQNPLYAVFTFLIKRFKKVWESLNLPNIPAILSLDPVAILNALIEPYIASIKNTYNALIKPFKDIKEGIEKHGTLEDYLKSQLSKKLGEIINALLAIQIPVIGLTLGELLGIKDFEDLKDGAIISPQAVLARLATRLANVFQDIALIILEQWIQKVKKFLDKIGLGAIFSLVPLTFCKFLQLLAPQLFSLGSLIQGIVDSSVAKIAKIDKLRKDLETLSKDPEKNKLAIQEIQKQISATLPLALNCTPT